MSSAWTGLANDITITELPHYAINGKLPEDAYYTDKKLAKYCVDVFWREVTRHNLNFAHHTFIEPSAGAGCFYDYLPDNKIGLDIKPSHPAIQQADFLSWYPLFAHGKYVVIGNPPFGVRGAMALAFINRSFLFADAVAFILPMSFHSNGKGSNMKRVKGGGLLYSEEIPAESFYLPDSDKRVSVKSIFQIWVKDYKSEIFADYKVDQYVDIFTCCSSPARFCGLGRGRKYDCFIASTFYQNVSIVHSFDEVLYGSGYGLLIKRDKERVLDHLRSVDWRKYSSNATNHCKHIRMYHIRKALGEGGFGERL